LETMGKQWGFWHVFGVRERFESQNGSLKSWGSFLEIEKVF